MGIRTGPEVIDPDDFTTIVLVIAPRLPDVSPVVGVIIARIRGKQGKVNVLIRCLSECLRKRFATRRRRQN
jgi:hypothetical protein